MKLPVIYLGGAHIIVDAPCKQCKVSCHMYSGRLVAQCGVCKQENIVTSENHSFKIIALRNQYANLVMALLTSSTCIVRVDLQREDSGLCFVNNAQKAFGLVVEDLGIGNSVHKSTGKEVAVHEWKISRKD